MEITKILEFASRSTRSEKWNNFELPKMNINIIIFQMFKIQKV